MKKYIVKFSQGQGSELHIQGTEFTITKEGVLVIRSDDEIVAAFNPAFWRAISEDK